MAYDFTPLKSKIKETEEWLSRELAGVRTGRATPTLLDGVKPEAYGARTPLAQIASVSVEDARTLRIIPYDPSLTKVIEKAIIDADIGISPSTDDQGLRVSFPELTAERRTQLVKIAKDKAEQARTTLRSHRTDAMKMLEAAEEAGGMGEDEVSRHKAEIQKLIDASNESVGEILKKKETEIAH